MKPGPFSSVAATLQWVAQRYGLQTKLLEYRLRREWPSIVGAQVARHTRPDAIRFRKLYLIADHSVWVHQLQFLKPSLVEKINDAAGESIVSDLVLRVGDVSADAAAANEAAPVPVRAPVNPVDPDPRLHAIGDPDLRAHWASVMARVARL